MTITNITLKNYRSFESYQIPLDPKLNIIVGDNAIGKTSILESIFVSAFSKSFRTKSDTELIQFDKKYAYVKIEFLRENGSKGNVEYKIEQNGNKFFKKSGVGITKLSDLLSNMQLVLFYPDDLRIIKGSPAERRNFLNRELSNISSIYCDDLLQYNKALANRNKLLKSNTIVAQEIEIWNELIAKYGAKILVKRIQYLERLNKICKELHASITNQKETIEVKYESFIEYQHKNYSTAMLEELFLKQLQINFEKDVRKGYTTVGLHKDDILIHINEKPAKIFASQGQQRTAALAVKLSEINVIKEDTGESPVLLLDDVMSELDYKRQRDMIYTFSNSQVLITTTDISHILDHYINASKLIELNRSK